MEERRSGEVEGRWMRKVVVEGSCWQKRREQQEGGWVFEVGRTGREEEGGERKQANGKGHARLGLSLVNTFC